MAKTTVAAFERRRPSASRFPIICRERVVVEAPASCTCCGSTRIVKMGEDITETLEVIPRQWKVIQTIREKFTCGIARRSANHRPPSTPRLGLGRPNLLAMVLFEKFGSISP